MARTSCASIRRPGTSPNGGTTTATSATRRRSASPILVGGMDVTGKDAVLASGHLISGVVSGPSGPIAGAWVTAWQGTCPASLTWKAGSSSDTSGHYSIRVASGTYLINTSMSGYQSEWFDDQLDCSGATPITVGTADVTGKNFVLAPTHNVTGRVTDNSGGVADALVLAQSAGSSCAPPVWIGFARTNGSGDYTLELPDGSYSIMFSDANHVSQFFNGRADCASADPVLVNGADVAGKNAVLTRTYAVTGTVTAAASGAPIAGAFVGAFSGSTFVAATTDDSGHYTVMLPNGTYTLRFDASGMATQWWIGQPTAVAAATFTVTNGVGP